MKKGLLALAMILVFGLTANVALTDETVVYPFWQHGWSCTTFWSAANVSTTDTVTVTINLLDKDGALVDSTSSTILPGAAWMPDTYMAWYDKDPLNPNKLGFGNYEVVANDNVVYLWGCVYGVIPGGLAGFTLVLPQNPYGQP